MDEPLAAFDAAARADILPYLDQLHRTLEVPVLYVSHSADEVLRLVDHLVCLDAGRVRWQGGAAEGLAELGLAAYAACVIAVEADMTVVECAGQVLRLPGLRAQPGDTLQLRIDAAGR